MIEHCIPGIILIRELIERAHDLTPESLIDLLSTRLTAAVITREENKLLDKVGLQARMPDGADPTDPWARYRAADLNPDEHVDNIDGIDQRITRSSSSCRVRGRGRALRRG